MGSGSECFRFAGLVGGVYVSRGWRVGARVVAFRGLVGRGSSRFAGLVRVVVRGVAFCGLGGGRERCGLIGCFVDVVVVF